MEMINKFKAVYARFVKAQKGNVAIIFGVMMVPTMVLTGGLVDYGMAIKTKSQLTSTLDAAMLAAMLQYADDEDVDYQKIIEDYIDTNFTSSNKKLHGTVIEVAAAEISDEGEMSASVKAVVPTSFLKFVHKDEFEFTISSAVMVGGSSIEVALVLDNTGSMSGDKIVALKGAANDLLDIIMPADRNNSDEKIKFSVVPFADYVNIGVEHRNEDGLDIPANYSVVLEPAKEVCTDPSSSDDDGGSDGPEQVCTPIKEWKTCYNDGVPYDCLKTVGQNCVTKEDDDEDKDDDDKDDDDKDKDDDDKDKDDDDKDDDDKDKDDDDKDKDDDDKDKDDDDKDKDDDDKDKDDDDKDKDDDDKDKDDDDKDKDDDDKDDDEEEEDKEPVCKIVPAKVKNYKWHGCVGSRKHDLNTRDDDYATGVPGMMYEWNWCRQIAPVTRLTSDRDTIVSGISKMSARRYTYLPSGLAWGWRSLSPNTPFADGASYSDGAVRKVIVLMTDGANTRSTWGKWNGLENDSRDWKKNLGRRSLHNQSEVYGHNGSNITNANQITAELCTNIKKEKIMVYTIGFEIEADSDIENIMKACAGNGGQYYDANNSTELADAFKEIGKSLLNLRLTK